MSVCSPRPVSPLSSYPFLSHCAQPLIAQDFSFTYQFPFFLFPLLGSPQALRSLLHLITHWAFLYAILRFDPSEPTTTKAAFTRALRTIAAACAELRVVGLSLWGLRDDSSPVLDEAKLAPTSLPIFMGQ